jgi:hypothetical protein
MSQRTTTFLRQHARFEEESQTHHRRKMEEALHHFGPALGRKFSAYLDHRKNNHNPSSIRLKTKVHPVSPLDNHTNLSEWKLEAAWAREVVHAETDDGYDDSFNPGSSCLLRMMDRQHLEKTWTRVLQICQSKVLRHLLQSDGKLIAVGIQDGTLSVFFLSKVAYLLSQAAASACFHGTHEENRKHVKGRVWLLAFISCPTTKLT